MGYGMLQSTPEGFEPGPLISHPLTGPVNLLQGFLRSLAAHQVEAEDPQGLGRHAGEGDLQVLRGLDAGPVPG